MYLSDVHVHVLLYVYNLCLFSLSHCLLVLLLYVIVCVYALCLGVVPELKSK